ncbi:YheC/YheD family protein [Paenibacillaceae bacterium]|nr:YheC/YheD family protein [Paenibacillaceae bacterium]
MNRKALPCSSDRKAKGGRLLAIGRVHSKWLKTKVLIKDPALHELIPQTKLFNKENLRQMLSQYSMVYVKPNLGTFGLGVIRVEQLPDGGYRLQTGTRSNHFSYFDHLHDDLKRRIGKRTFLVQRGVHLLKHKNRRFDLRVMVQKNLNDKWETTGVIGRLSHPQKIVTNYHSGGTPMSFEKLMSGHMSSAQQQDCVSRLNKLGRHTAKQLQSTYPRLKEIGVDVALDSDFKPWILEVNTKPDPYIFRKLKDKRIFSKIYRYAAAYGRFSSKKRKSPS